MNDNGFDSINVIPLVDVMLVLLTIVLTTTTFIAVGAIPVDLPKAENSSNAESAEVVTIEIDKKGTIYLDQTPVSTTQLKKSLAELERMKTILIRADRDIALQVFVNVMDIVKGLGFSKVSLQTESMT